MDNQKRASATRRHLLTLAVVLAAVLIPYSLRADTPTKPSTQAELCVSELCDGDSIQQVLVRNLHKRVQLVLRSGVQLTGTVNKVTGHLVQLTNISHRTFYDAVVDLKEIGGVVMRVRSGE